MGSRPPMQELPVGTTPLVNGTKVPASLVYFIYKGGSQNYIKEETE